MALNRISIPLLSLLSASCGYKTEFLNDSVIFLQNLLPRFLTLFHKRSYWF